MSILITLVGRTGDGKSTCGNEILRQLGNNSHPFGEGAGTDAHTRASKGVVAEDVIVVDNPGLMDTLGDIQDSKNIADIALNARKYGHLNMLVLVLNARNYRFDSGLQNAMKLISDSFGKASLNHLFILYTNRFGSKDSVLQQRTNEILQKINKCCQTQLTHLTYYAVENHPEEYVPDISDETVARLHSDSYSQIKYLLTAARGQTAYNTANIIPGKTVLEEEAAKRAQIERDKKRAEDRAKEAERQLAEVRARAEAEAKAKAEEAAKEAAKRYISGLTRDQSAGSKVSCSYTSNVSQAITGIGGYYTKRRGRVNERSWAGWQRATGDLWENLGRDIYVYIYTQQKKGEHPIVEIGISLSYSSIPSGCIAARWLDPENSDSIYVDIRKGQGGADVYLWYRVDSSVVV